jgi:hypothetical protein
VRRVTEIVCGLSCCIQLMTACEPEEVGWYREQGGSATFSESGGTFTVPGKGGTSLALGGSTGFDFVCGGGLDGTGSGPDPGAPNVGSGGSAGVDGASIGGAGGAGSPDDAAGAVGGTAMGMACSASAAGGTLLNVGGTVSAAAGAANDFGCPTLEPRTGDICDWSRVTCFYESDQCGYYACCYGRWKRVSLCN